MPSPHRLSAPLRRLWILTWSLLGILPTALFFIWLERGGTLPWLGPSLGFPWLNGIDWPVPFQWLWNLLLISFFGFTHTALAQEEVRNWLLKKGRPSAVWKSLLRPETSRAFYVVITGLSLWVIPAFWQGTGQIAWQVPGLAPSVLIGASFSLYWGLLAFSAFLMSRHGTARFLGLTALAEALPAGETPSQELITRGLYRWVRHPIYTVTLAAFFLTPLMTWDRLLVSLGMTFYLGIGVPIEERKLIRQFGPAYERYRKRVPALFPLPGRKSE